MFRYDIKPVLSVLQRTRTVCSNTLPSRLPNVNPDRNGDCKQNGNQNWSGVKKQTESVRFHSSRLHKVQREGPNVKKGRRTFLLPILTNSKDFLVQIRSIGSGLAFLSDCRIEADDAPLN